MIIINEIEEENKRLVKTFKDINKAKEYLENCLMLNTYILRKTKYELKEL